MFTGGPLGYTDLSVFSPPQALFTPHILGDLKLPNRIVCSSLTRGRAGIDGVPTDLHAEYYSARVSSAFMVTEGVAISVEANGAPGACCLYNDA